MADKVTGLVEGQHVLMHEGRVGMAKVLLIELKPEHAVIQRSGDKYPEVVSKYVLSPLPSMKEWIRTWNQTLYSLGQVSTDVEFGKFAPDFDAIMMLGKLRGIYDVCRWDWEKEVHERNKRYE